MRKLKINFNKNIKRKIMRNEFHINFFFLKEIVRKKNKGIKMSKRHCRKMYSAGNILTILQMNSLYKNYTVGNLYCEIIIKIYLK